MSIARAIGDGMFAEPHGPQTFVDGIDKLCKSRTNLDAVDSSAGSTEREHGGPEGGAVTPSGFFLDATRCSSWKIMHESARKRLGPGNALTLRRQIGRSSKVM